MTSMQAALQHIEDNGKAENNAALAAYEAAELSGDLARVWPAWAEIVARINTEEANGDFAECARVQAEMNRIIRDRKARKAARHYAIAAE